MRPKKRRRTTPSSATSNAKANADAGVDADALEAMEGDGDGQGDAAAGPSWKPVELQFELLKAFENEGGIIIEECDDAGVTYGDDDQNDLVPSDEEAASAAVTSAKRKVGEKKRMKKKERAKAEEAEGSVTAHKDGSDAAKLSAASKASSSSAPSKSLNVEHGSQDSHAPLHESPEVLHAKLPAWAPFNLHTLLLAGLSQLNFDKPTEVQARCLMPAIIQRKDVVGAAETGSGKTLAFGLPILHHTLCALDAAGESATVDSRRRPLASVAGHLRALAVLPTRELAVQVQSHINAAAQRTGLRAQCVVGGMSSQKQRRLLGRRPAIVVGTPGRLFALLGLSQEDQQERCDWFRDGLSGLRHLVLDEADRLVESGHFKELDSILGLVYQSLERPQQLQTFVFSATLTLDPRMARKSMRGAGESKVDKLMRRMQFRDARAVHLVDLTKPEQDVEAKADTALAAPSGLGARLPAQLKLREMSCSSDKDREAFLVLWLLRRYRWEYMLSEGGLSEARGGPLGAEKPSAASRGGRVVLFVNAISSVLRLSSVLAMVLESPSARKVLSKVRINTDGRDKPCISVDVLGLHSRMKQRDRLRQVEQFRALEHAVLVCTDIAARGLDVPGIAAVIHYHPPRSPEVFIHRSGRTARAGREGESVAVTGPGDAVQWARVYRAAGIPQASVEDSSPTAFELAAAREAARLAADLEGKIHRSKKQRSDKSWMRRTAEAAELVLSEDEADKDKGKDMAPKKALWGLYQQMLARVRRLPKRQGAAPLPRRRRRR